MTDFKSIPSSSVRDEFKFGSIMVEGLILEHSGVLIPLLGGQFTKFVASSSDCGYPGRSKLEHRGF